MPNCIAQRNKFCNFTLQFKLTTMQGRVKWFDAKRGYGFITGSDGVDVYVHYTAIQSDGFRTLKHNWCVGFDVIISADGRPEAHNVQVQAKR